MSLFLRKPIINYTLNKKSFGEHFVTIPKLFTLPVSDAKLDWVSLGLRTLFAPQSLSKTQLIQGITNLSVGATALGIAAAAAAGGIAYAKKAGRK